MLYFLVLSFGCDNSFSKERSGLDQVVGTGAIDSSSCYKSDWIGLGYGVSYSVETISYATLLAKFDSLLSEYQVSKQKDEVKIFDLEEQDSVEVSIIKKYLNLGQLPGSGEDGSSTLFGHNGAVIFVNSEVPHMESIVEVSLRYPLLFMVLLERADTIGNVTSSLPLEERVFTYLLPEAVNSGKVELIVIFVTYCLTVLKMSQSEALLRQMLSIKSKTSAKTVKELLVYNTHLHEVMTLFSVYTNDKPTIQKQIDIIKE